jgi:hypothetical protein
VPGLRRTTARAAEEVSVHMKKFIDVEGTAWRRSVDHRLVHWIPGVTHHSVGGRDRICPYYSACNWDYKPETWLLENLVSHSSRDVTCLLCVCAVNPYD